MKWIGPLITSIVVLLSVITPVIGGHSDFSNQPCSNGVIAHWALDETSGTIAYDSTGIHNGTIYDAVIGQPGVVNKCYWFDGTNDNDHIRVNNNNNLNFNDGEDFSIYAWIKTTIKDYRRILEKRAVAGNGYLMAVWNDGKLRATVLKEGGGEQATIYSNMDVADGQWHQVGMVRNGSMLEMFVDGESMGTNNSAGGNLSNDNLLYIGTDCGEYWERLY